MLFPDILKEILGAIFIASPILDLDLAFGADDYKVGFDCTALLA